MPGAILAVVGPSGAGKDTLIDAARRVRPDLVIVRRVITRPETAGGEPFEGVTAEEFARRRTAGGFVLDWQAHGLRYGIPVGVLADLAAGRTVIFNGSRAMLAQAGAAFPGLVVIHVTAPVPVLAARLAARGRESAEDIARRLSRAPEPFPPGLPVREVQNAGALETAVAAFLDALQPVRV
ncbi:phosphonate metabolism protein/1,5-bisphosphokinase (PRPP-forming) PhnN [Paracoccaceae bacterium Fryx2]|nr:phosphonate metabolism protein/1,5-bisphosphokinase (PRPP-forming) PhnN [Paracoccaceae bacterium Fryx2]